ncbi:hypothetical protein BOQ64_15190 [Chryseobacterium sp. CH25]|nr:hypothetical protein BOQ64_15190 [Chryseobacterium sp. CH25]
MTVTNDRYENDNGHRNYDEYLGQDKIQVRTNNEGYYSITFKKSAYVYIYLEKEGYQSLEEKGRQAQKLLTFKTSMNKTSPR